MILPAYTEVSSQTTVHYYSLDKIILYIMQKDKMTGSIEYLVILKYLIDD